MVVLDNFLTINLSGISLKILKFSSQKSFPVLFWLWQRGEGMEQSHFLSSKGPSSQDYGFSSVYVWCKSWTINKAECWRIYAFELCCWRRLLRVPWTTRRCNQSILKEISPGCSLEGLILKLKLQYFGHLMGRADSFEKTLMLEKIEGRRGRQRMRSSRHNALRESHN